MAEAASAQVTTEIFSRRKAILMTSRMVALSSMKYTVGVRRAVPPASATGGNEMVSLMEYPRSRMSAQWSNWQTAQPRDSPAARPARASRTTARCSRRGRPVAPEPAGTRVGVRRPAALEALLEAQARVHRQRTSEPADLGSRGPRPHALLRDRRNAQALRYPLPGRRRNRRSAWPSSQHARAGSRRLRAAKPPPA